MNSGINKNFIFNYLSGKASALQKQMIDEWVKEPANEELFYQWLAEYEYQSPQYIADVTAGIERFEKLVTQMEQDESNAAFPTYPHHHSPRLSLKIGRWLAAASVLLALFWGGWAFRDGIIYKTYTTNYGQTQQLVLDDGTQVTLNANSSLRVPRFGFGADTREVKLTGEANFSVVHTADDQRFVVKTDNNFDVLVLGTEFTVYTRQRGSKVVLHKGKVQLRYQTGKTQRQLTMQPGDLVKFDRQNHLSKVVTKEPEKYTAWKEHLFVFDDTTLEEFTQIMADNYGIEVILADETLA
ncbi:MAG: FecR domain-containing protein, partial [Spirosomaceae bacterium]|nr:FecR domain-containing protein [Spirosomataceae bacterium]